MADESQPSVVIGTITDLEDGVARILIGARREEWWFPTSMLPAKVRPGDVLDFEPCEGRYLVLGPSVQADALTSRSIEDRLSRPLSSKKTDRVHARGLRRLIEDTGD